MRTHTNAHIPHKRAQKHPNSQKYRWLISQVLLILWCMWQQRGDIFTVELGVLVPYPEEGRDAKDHRLPSALQKTEMSPKSPIWFIRFVTKNKSYYTYYHDQLCFFQYPAKNCEMPLFLLPACEIIMYLKTYKTNTKYDKTQHNDKVHMLFVPGPFLWEESNSQLILHASNAQWQAGRRIRRIRTRGIKEQHFKLCGCLFK